VPGYTGRLPEVCTALCIDTEGAAAGLVLKLGAAGGAVAKAEADAAESAFLPLNDSLSQNLGMLGIDEQPTNDSMASKSVARVAIETRMTNSLCELRVARAGASRMQCERSARDRLDATDRW
jgi:hypothetical protein